MKYKIWKKKFKLKEHQIIFMNREFGESKLDKKIILEAVYGVLRLRLDSLLIETMSNKILIKNSTIVNEGLSSVRDILIEGSYN